MQLTTEIYPDYTLVLIQLDKDENLVPEQLKTLEPPAVDGTRGVVISGRAPIWLYAFLVHHYHPTAWIATHDPRLGYVIVESHNPKVAVGTVLSPTEPIIV